MNSKQKLLLPILLCCGLIAAAQDTANKKPPFKISGTIGVNYEHYGLSRKPTGWTGFTPRKPWNQLRFNFTPTMQFGKNFSLPVNFNFATTPTNFAGPYTGIGKQNLGQFITHEQFWAESQIQMG
jgi:hypothetical protein